MARVLWGGTVIEGNSASTYDVPASRRRRRRGWGSARALEVQIWEFGCSETGERAPLSVENAEEAGEIARPQRKRGAQMRCGDYPGDAMGLKCLEPGAGFVDVDSSVVDGGHEVIVEVEHRMTI